MNIAVLDPHPRMCGVSAFAHHVKAGFNDAGHHAEVVTATRSGRRRKSQQPGYFSWRESRWWGEPPDVVGKWSVMHETLDEYDLIFLVEPKCAPDDRQALNDVKKERKPADWLPEYIQALQKTATPWFTMTHGMQYDDKRAPYLKELLEAGNFIPIILANQHGTAEGARPLWDAQYEWHLNPYLPCRRVFSNESVPGDGHTVGIAGRVTSVKGQGMLAMHVDELLPPQWTLRIDGNAANSMSANATYVMYQYLTERLKYVGERPGQNPEEIDEFGNSGDKIAPWPWHLTTPQMRHVHYHGVFGDPVGVYDAYDIFVNLTSADFSAGMLEYTTLHAIDAGSILVIPEHQIRDLLDGKPSAFHHMVRNPSNIPSTVKKDINTHPDDLESLRMALHAATDLIQSYPDDVSTLRGVNRSYFDQHHSPKVWAEQTLDVLEPFLE